MTTYVVFSKEGGDDNTPPVKYVLVAEEIEANNAEQACRRVAEKMDDKSFDGGGIELIAIPARNWASGRHTLKAETTRRIRSA